MSLARLNPIPSDLWARLTTPVVLGQCEYDLSEETLAAAREQLGEAPIRLRVSGPDYDLAQRLCPDLTVTPDMAIEFAWELVGATRTIRSEWQ